VNRLRLERWLIIVATAAGGISLLVLLAATRNTSELAANLPALLLANGILLLLVVGLVAWQLLRLLRRRRDGAFGSQLMGRLVLLFTLMAVLPGAVIYGVSVYFLRSSIDSWFDVRIERAIDGGLSLGRGAIDKLLVDLQRRGESLALDLVDTPPGQQYSKISSAVATGEVGEVALFDSRGRLLMVVGAGLDRLAPDLPVAPLLATLRGQRQFAAVEPVEPAGLMLRSLHWLVAPRPDADARVLQLLQPVPAEIAGEADKVQTGWAEYQTLILARGSLKELFLFSLTLTLMLAALIAVAAAIYLADRLSAPLAQLGRGTAAIAAGDLSVQLKGHSRDEMGALAGSFNRMTQQLREARATLIDQQTVLAATNAYLQGLLENLSSGVLAFDQSLALRSANSQAAERLGVAGSDTTALAAALSAVGTAGSGLVQLGEALRRQMTESRGHWRLEHRLATARGERVLLLRGSPLDELAEGGHVVVFDDITDVVQAQRDLAWEEVARRLAHEIKNPLTPIQLSAERLEHKLAARLDADDAAVLQRSTRLIVNQVDAMKRMVRDFADFSRPGGSQPPVPLALEQLLDEVLGLYEDLEPLLERRFDASLPKIAGQPTQLRQVLHNLLANAKDALEGRGDARLRVGLVGADGGVRLTVTDNGPGFPAELMTRAFEPYTTTKERGTGLGLAIVRKIVEAHGGRVDIANVEPQGACVTVWLPAVGVTA